MDSVFDEPHLTPDPKRPDPSEKKAEKIQRDSQEELASSGQGVHDEPAIFPDSDAETIRGEWSCERCGSNLVGRIVGEPCPTCGLRQWSRPAPPEAVSYGGWLRERAAHLSPDVGWGIALAAVIVGGGAAIGGAMIGSFTQMRLTISSFFLTAVIGPAVEEAMKIATCAMVIEIRPYLFSRRAQIYVATLGAAFVFAAIENVLYLHVYIEEPTELIFLWRWTVCVALHVGCTAVATRGLTRIWHRTMTEYRRPVMAQGFGPLATAIVLHGCYNASALLYQVFVKGTE